MLLKRLLFISCLIISVISKAQTAPDPVLDTIQARFSNYALSHLSPDLHLHLDKTIYVPNENIWFTGYVLNRNQVQLHHTLHVLLIKESSKAIVASEQFLMNNGIGKGNLFVHDSLSAGEYRLVAYTNSFPANKNGKVFQQFISIRTSEAYNNLPFSLSFLPEAYAVTKDSASFTYKVLTSYGGLATGGDFSYTLLADGKNLQSGKQKINPFGEVNFRLAKEMAIGKKLRLEATVARAKEKQLIKTDVPILQNVVMLKLYPEGGNLVHNHPAKVAFELKNSAGMPVAAKGRLLEEGKEIAQFTSDVYGLGSLSYVPHQKSTYSIKFDDNSLQPIYSFPGILAEGFSIQVANAVIKDTSFAVVINTPAEGRYFYILLHNYSTAFFTGKLFLSGTSGKLNLSTEGIPDGVTTITLFDENGIPQTERAVYIRKMPPVTVSLTTDSSSYHKRSKVQLKIKVTNSQGQPVPSVFSLACVLDSRVDSLRYADIVRVNQFDRFLPDPRVMPSLHYFSKDEHIEMTLLTKFWTRYTWTGANAASYTFTADRACIAGDVYYKRRKAKKPVEMMITGGTQQVLFSTDSTGHFELPSHLLAAMPDKKVTVLVAEKQKYNDYRLELYQTCEDVASEAKQLYYPEGIFQRADLSVEEQKLLKNALKAVVVTAKKKDNITNGIFKSTTCNDWVCLYNILNCPNHPIGANPENGAEYRYEGKRVIYISCVKDTLQPAPFMRLIKGTYYPKEFYVADYHKFNPSAAETMSTVYWSHETVTDENGEAQITFYTNDLNGRFQCLLQGLETNGVISGRTSFKVVKDE